MNIKALIISLFCVVLGCESPESPEIIPESPEIIPEVPLDLTGVTWAHINANDTGNIFIDSVIVCYDEILGYDSALHTYLIDPIAGERIRSILYPTSGSRFVVAVDSVIIFTALFFPAYSSSLVPTGTIATEPYSASYKYRFGSGYPPDLHPGEDPRNDSRIIERFQEDNKLIVLDD